MNEFPLKTFPSSHQHQNQQNCSPLRFSSKYNTRSENSEKNQNRQAKQSPKLAQKQLLQKTLKAYEQTISRQKVNIQALKSELKSNCEYTTALEQKYTILLQSIQPFHEKVNLEKLVDKISNLQNRFEAIQKLQVDPTSFNLLKLTQKTTSISTGEIDSQKFCSHNSLSQKCLGQVKNEKMFKSEKLNQAKAQIKETGKSSLTQKQERVRKQSTDSEVGIQVSFEDDQNVCIKKSHIQRFISLESELKNNQINLSRKRKNSESEENISDLWQKIVNDYLTNDDGFNTKFKHRSEYLLKKGIPYELRSTVWPMIFENQLGITWQFYMQLLQRRQKGWVEETVRTQIRKDLNRSFSGKGKQIENKDKLIDQVQQVLELFDLYRPDVSYIQGMTYPAIVLTTVVGKMRAFCILANQIIGIPFFKRLYTFEAKFPTIYCKTFDLLLKDVNSSVYELLQKKQINSEIFLVQWFYTFFSRGLNFETTLKVWDHMAYYGQVTIFKLGVAVIELVAPFLNDATTQSAMSLIKQFSSYTDENKLMDGFLNSKVTEQRYKKAFKKAFKSSQL